MKFYFLLLLNFFVLSSIFAAEKFTKDTVLSKSKSPILIVVTDSDRFIGSVELQIQDLPELKIFSISPMDRQAYYGDDGYIVMVKDGNVLESIQFSDAIFKKMSFAAQGNKLRPWIYQSLKKHNSKFNIEKPAEEQTDPANDPSAGSISEGLAAYFPLYKDFENLAPNKRDARFTPGRTGKHTFLNNSYYNDGVYNTCGTQTGVLRLNNNISQDGFSVSLNFFPETRKDDRLYLLFSLGGKFLNFYRDQNTGKLLFTTAGWCRNCGKDNLLAAGLYEYTDVTVELEKWHSMTVSVDLKNKKISVIYDGKRLKDINPSNEIVFYRNERGNELLDLENGGFGVVFKGFVKDVVGYNRVLSGNEMMAVQKKYAMNKTEIVKKPDPVPENKNLPIVNEALLKAARTGNTKGVTEAVNNGAEIDTKYKGWTPLLFAVFYGHEDTVKELIKSEANPLVEISGYNALRLAKSKNHKGIADFLEDYGNKSRFYDPNRHVQKNSRGTIIPPEMK